MPFTTHEPAPRIVTVTPEIEHTRIDDESIESVTDPPAEEVAESVNAGEPTFFAPGSEIEIVAAWIPTTDTGPDDPVALLEPLPNWP